MTNLYWLMVRFITLANHCFWLWPRHIWPPAVPRGMAAALDLFVANTALQEVLGPEFGRVYAIVKQTEYDEFLQVISPWEREHLLLNV